MIATLDYDDSLWPLLLQRITGVMTDEQLAFFLERSEFILERGEPYIGITDVTQAGVPPLAHCRQLAEWMRAHTAGMRELLLCNIIILNSAPLRLSTSLVFHFVPPPMPHLVVATLDSAVEFALGKLVEARLNPDVERIRRHLSTAWPPRGGEG
jgi:hypothetical protein